MSDSLRHCADNLDMRRRYIKDETADLIYFDPRFNSNVTYYLLSGEQSGFRAAG